MIKNYRNKTRREVTLSSGDKVLVRGINIGDLSEIGEMPTAEKIKENPGSTAKYMRVVLLNCVSIPDGKIVDKAPEDCGEKEISWREFNQDDINLIVNATQEKGDAAPVATFPKEQAPVA